MVAVRMEAVLDFCFFFYLFLSYGYDQGTDLIRYTEKQLLPSHNHAVSS